MSDTVSVFKMFRFRQIITPISYLRVYAYPFRQEVILHRCNRASTLADKHRLRPLSDANCPTYIPLVYCASCGNTDLHIIFKPDKIYRFVMTVYYYTYYNSGHYPSSTQVYRYVRTSSETHYVSITCPTG
jgi:hypothetical protein